MRLSPRIRILLGLVTTALFFSAGATFLAGGGNILGYLLLGLGTYRGYVLIRQIRWFLQSDDE